MAYSSNVLELLAPEASIGAVTKEREDKWSQSKQPQVCIEYLPTPSPGGGGEILARVRHTEGSQNNGDVIYVFMPMSTPNNFDNTKPSQQPHLQSPLRNYKTNNQGGISTRTYDNDAVPCSTQFPPEGFRTTIIARERRLGMNEILLDPTRSGDSILSIIFVAAS